MHIFFRQSGEPRTLSYFALPYRADYCRRGCSTIEREIDVAVRDIITEAFEQATTILRTSSADLGKAADCYLRARR